MTLIAGCSAPRDENVSAQNQAWGGGSDGGIDGGSDGGSPTTFTMPLPIPQTLSPSTGPDPNTDYYVIHAKPGTAQILSSSSATPIWGFNGLYPGPTLVATRGRAVSVQMFNDFSENITIHNHGHFVAASSDGHPTDYIAPGSSKTYQYPNNQRAGTYWYHDHTMDLTGAHVYSGLAAFYLIHDPAEDALNLPSGAYDIPLVLQDRTFNSDNTLSYTVSSSTIRTGFAGDTAVVNGVAMPYLSVATHKYRFRLLNGSNARSYTVKLSNGAPFSVIASDGGLLTAPVSTTALSIAPAERYDIVVDFTGYAIGTTLTLDNTENSWPSALPTLMQFRVTTPVSDSSAVPSSLSTITRLTAAQATVTRNWTFQESSGDWTINGLLYDPSRIDATPARGTIERWVLDNRSGEMHPFHMHLVQFNVLSLGRSAPPPEQSGWKDTVAVPAWGSAEVVMQFPVDSFTGTYVLHCHKLEHEDHRMMLQMQVK